MDDEKLTALTRVTSLNDSDLLYAAIDPGGTPLSRAITKANATAGLGAVWGAITGTLSAQTDLQYFLNSPDGTMLNGKIVPTVSANDLILTLQTLAGNNPSAGEPVWVKINGTWRSITAALSVTAVDGTNWCNAGGSELATKEIDYFAYLGYNATDGVVLGFSRIPFANLYSDFSATSTSETYCKISTITNAAAGDNYVNIGRFAATLSAGAGYTWTVPTYTTANLVQKPCYETRWLDWQPVFSALGSLTYTSVTTVFARYKFSGESNVDYCLRSSGTLGGSANNGIFVTLPFDAGLVSLGSVGSGVGNTASVTAFAFIVDGTPDYLTVRKYDSSNYATSGTCVISLSGSYEV